MGEWLQIINLIAVVTGGVIGYFLVERVNTEIEVTKIQLDQTKLSIDISKFLNDIRPTLNDDCTAWATSPVQVKVSCSVKNIGVHRILLDKPLAKLRIKGQEEFINSKYFAQKLPNDNALPPGTEGTSSYIIEVPSPADWSRVEVVTEINAKTDGIIIDIAKTTLSGSVDPKYVDALSRHGYVFTNQIDISSIISTAQRTLP
ncbi:hypothetical protein GCM10011419_28130 [Vogesella fluminis]|uniref:Uncharacterized protein n=1 Tax=Vogesella fluminis TaxID=1069161 RepID=A0ABQ3HDS6_9NEIS|nr:hypothetical protein GCM10011419_28130 [Vogesella fluminis]